MGLPSSRTVRRSRVEGESHKCDVIRLGIFLEALGVGQMSKGANAGEDRLSLRLAVAGDESALLVSLSVLVEDRLAELGRELDAVGEQNGRR